MLERELRGSQAFRYHVNLWGNFDHNDPRRCYEWLASSLDDVVDRVRYRRNQGDWHGRDKRQPNQPDAAAATETKTKRDCWFWGIGTCTLGKNCDFSHAKPKGHRKGPNGEVPPTPPKLLALAGNRGQPGAAAPQQPGRRRSQTPQGRAPSQPAAAAGNKQPCWKFAQGKCDNADCPREHRQLTPAERKQMEEALKAQKARSQSPAGGKKLCASFQKTGHCVYGQRCRDSHDIPNSPKGRGRGRGRAGGKARGKGNQK